ncbi:MAG: 8-amino-7-oxononanoate synthase [Nocardioidaceae bacterium]
MTAHHVWLAEQAAIRERAGLTRQLGSRAQTRLDLAGNDYLGLSCDRRVVAAAVAATRAWGAGAGASRLVTGTLPLHTELEQALARFTGAPAGLVLSSGYAANLAVLTALADVDTLVVSDAHVHASLVDGARLARGAVQVVPHNDVAAVRTALAGRTQARAIVVCESVYSVLGDAAPLGALVDLCEELDALLVVDEAHGIGVSGDGGRGQVHGLRSGPHAGVVARRVVVTATLSKALGSQGGAVLAAPAVLDHLVNVARPFVYDTGLAPAATAAATAAVHVLESVPDLVERVHAHAAALAAACGVEPPAGAVLSVPMPSPGAAVAASTRLADDDLAVGCFRPPSVPDGVSRLRLAGRADLSPAELAHACRTLRTVVADARHHPDEP